ncbi:MAG TPA: c-type cytochrome [Steroidobacteraceae bacterium]|jgi:cytochrome c|nr:c-type cytochrome [Steroidobacteraceae bacterium]
MIGRRSPLRLAFVGAITLMISWMHSALADDVQPAASAAIVKRGSILYLQCAACHDVAANGPASQEGDTLQKVGPSLHGLLNRSAATQGGYRYSDALRKAGLTWDESSLDRWIENPASLVPGTTMVYPGMVKEADRRALIAYLKSSTR